MAEGWRSTSSFDPSRKRPWRRCLLVEGISVSRSARNCPEIVDQGKQGPGQQPRSLATYCVRATLYLPPRFPLPFFLPLFGKAVCEAAETAPQSGERSAAELPLMLVCHAILPFFPGKAT